MKYIVNIFILVFITIGVFAEIPKYEMELVTSIPEGEEFGELNYYQGSPTEPSYPTAFTFDTEGHMYVADLYNNRVMIYNSKLEPTSEIKEEMDIPWPYAFLMETGRNKYIYCRDRKIFTDVIKGKEILGVSVFQTGSKEYLDPYHTVFIGETAFNWDEEGNIYCLSEPLEFGQNYLRKYIGKDEIKAMLADPENGFENVRLDDKNRLFINGELLTREWEIFQEYYEEIYGPDYREDSRHDNKFPPSERDLVLIGQDVEGNKYWTHSSGGVVFVFNSKGFSTSIFTYNEDKSIYLPAVYPSGDVYFMDYDKENGFFEINRIRRRW